MGQGVLGQAGSTEFTGSYSLLRPLLQADATTSFDTTAVANLQSTNGLKTMINGVVDNNNSTNNTTMRVNSANLKALGCGCSVYSVSVLP